MPKNETSQKEMQQMVNLLQQLLAIELWRGGLSQADIGKRIGIATGSVNKILKGIDR